MHTQSKSHLQNHLIEDLNKPSQPLSSLEKSKEFSISTLKDNIPGQSQQTPSSSLYSADILSRHPEDRADLLSNRSQITESTLQARRDLSIFPIFDDRKLAKLSVNYTLYFEMYRVGIWLFSYLLAFSAFIYLSLPSSSIDNSYISSNVPLKFFFAVMYGSLNEYHIQEISTLCLIGLITNFFFGPFWLHMRNKILKNRSLYKNRWTEDLFSLMIEGLPLNVTQEEIKRYFDHLFSSQGIKGSVQDIILLQDCSNYYTITKTLHQTEQKLNKAKDEGSIQKIEEEINDLKTRLEVSKKELEKSEKFKGKAIVIFNNMRTKAKVVEYFSSRWYQILHICFLKSLREQRYFEGQKLSICELSEPKYVCFKNLHYSKLKDTLRNSLAYILSIVVLIITRCLNMTVQLVKNDSDSHIISTLKSCISSIILTLLYAVLTRLYRGTKKLRKSYKTTRMDESMIPFGIFLSICLFNPLQTTYTNMYAPISDLGHQLNILVFVTSGKNLLTKLYKLYYKKEFNPLQEAMQLYPILLIGSSVFYISPFIVLSVSIISLYIMAIIDKQRLIRSTNLLLMKPTYLIMHLFGVFKWILILIWVYNTFILLILFARYKEYISELILAAENAGQSINPTLELRVGYDTVIFQGFYVLGFLLTLYSYSLWPKSLNDEIKDKFYNDNLKVPYAEVRTQFSSTYRSCDPQSSLKREKADDGYL